MGRRFLRNSGWLLELELVKKTRPGQKRLYGTEDCRGEVEVVQDNEDGIGQERL